LRHVARMEEMKITYVLDGKLLDVGLRIILKWILVKYIVNVSAGFKKLKAGVQWRECMNTALNLRVP